MRQKSPVIWLKLLFIESLADFSCHISSHPRQLKFHPFTVLHNYSRLNFLNWQFPKEFKVAALVCCIPVLLASFKGSETLFVSHDFSPLVTCVMSLFFVTNSFSMFRWLFGGILSWCWRSQNWSVLCQYSLLNWEHLASRGYSTVLRQYWFDF